MQILFLIKGVKKSEAAIKGAVLEDIVAFFQKRIHCGP